MTQVIITFVYLTVSISGYLLWGDEVKGNVLDSGGQSIEWTIGRCGLALAVALTYPLLMVPARICFDWLITELVGAEPPIELFEDEVGEENELPDLDSPTAIPPYMEESFISSVGSTSPRLLNPER